MAIVIKDRQLSIITRTKGTGGYSGDPAVTYTFLKPNVRRQKNGNILPGYKYLITSGQSATTSYEGFKHALAYTPGKIEVMYYYPFGAPNNGKVGYTTFCGLNVDLASESFDSSLRAAALNSAAIGIRNKIAQQRSLFSGPTFLGEARESIHMIRHPAEAARKYVDNYFNFLHSHRRKKGGKKAFTKAVAGTWLEFSFGLKPLINDIGAIAEAALQTIDEDHIIRLSYTGHADSAVSSTYSNGAGSGIPGICYYPQEMSSTATCRFIVGYRRKISGCKDPLLNVASLSRFNWAEIIPTAWELLPWSFLIDYFSNIGDVLSADLTSLEDVVWINKTERQVNKLSRSSGSYVCGSVDNTQHIVMSAKLPSYEAQCIVVSRSSDNIPFGTFAFELPGRATQFLNIAALATMRFK